MAPSRNGIPVPREQRTGAAHGRRPSLREAAQAPWRSSLDLVWSYSRSQAFYGDNIATSPSFADRHWAGPSHGMDSSVDEELTEEDETDDEETIAEESSSMNDYDEDDDDANRDLTASPAAPMQWGDEQLPVNAIQNRRNSGRGTSSLGRREKRTEAAGSRRSSRVMSDRQLSRIAADHQIDEERSRSRSRSPKRLTSIRQTSGLRTLSSTDEGSDSNGLETTRTSANDTKYNENTPLLSSSTMEPDRTGYRIIRTPSWFRSSAVSGTTTKFRLQGYGSSTFWQSWFNTVNALIGVGILALPLAISYAGLVLGVLLFILCGLVTNYTGKVLANIMSTESSLRTYADIGNFAFGTKARLMVSFFFALELWAVSTALIILFGDSAKAIVVSSVEEGAGGVLEIMARWPPAAFKALGTLIVLPTMFLPLKFLSPISVVGIISIFTLLIVVLSDGLSKEHGPGSLWEPAATNLGPVWSRLPLSFGLIMSGFSTHPIVPSIFKDMKNPAEFRKMLNLAYLAAACIYLSMGLIGYLMFGDDISDEITRNLAQTKGYSKLLNRIALWLILVNPLAKFALAARPIDTTIELIMGVEASQEAKQLPKLRATRSGRLKYLSGDGSNSTKVPLLSEAATEAGLARQGGADGSEDEDEDDASTPRLGASSSAFKLDAQVKNGGRVAPQESPLAGSAISIRAAERTADWSSRSRKLARIMIQIGLTFLIGGTAILLPGFETVMAFLGAFLACATCIFGPLLANLRLLRHEMSRLNVIIDVIILFIFVIVATLGTIWPFLPNM